MSEHNPVVENFYDSGYDLYLDEIYYIAYSDQKFMAEYLNRKLTKKEFEERYARYMQILQWPEGIMKFKEIAQLPADANPNFVKITGRMIMQLVEMGFVPQFDYYFEKTRQLVMVPLEAYEFYEQYSKTGGRISL